MRRAFVVVFVGCSLPSRATLTPAPSSAVPPSAPPVASVPPSPPVAVKPAPRVFSVETGNLIRGWSADAFQDGRVEGHRWGNESAGDDKEPPCTAAMTAARLAANARSLTRCCGMKVRSLATEALPVDQQWVEVQLGTRECRTMQSGAVWRDNAEAHACQEAVRAFWRETCGSGR